MSKWQAEIAQVLRRIEEGECKDCNLIGLAEHKPCEVCRLLNKDESLKLCKWCQSCNAWICEDDVTNYLRRGRAFLKRL